MINSDEIRYAWNIDNMFMIYNQRGYDDGKIRKLYPGATKINSLKSYSSDSVDKIPKETLKKIIENENLTDK